MVSQSVINVDLADVFEQPDRKGFLHTLAWGDYVEVLETTDTYLRISTVKYEETSNGSILPVKTEAYICPTKSSNLSPADIAIPQADSKVLKVNFVDVQQGDGAVIESPDGKIILVDGGDNQLFARYLAARFRGTSLTNPKSIDCILVTHGDADHFDGLTQIHASETNPEPRKRLFIEPKRVYHNGLVKRPSKDKHNKTIPEKELLGPTQVVDGETILTGLVESLLDVPNEEMNQPFRQWKEALKKWNDRSNIEFRRLSFGEKDAFDFFNNGDLEISVLGPFVTEKGSVRGLKFLGNPPKGPRIGHESMSLGEADFKGFSASHTINGHSIVFRLRYGGFSYLFCGDLNDEASRILGRKHQKGEINLRSEVFKVPHHGSADFSGAFFQMVSPIVSVISSGDESAKQEYIHPRATLVGALGRHSRVDEPLIFVTELVAFFNLEGWASLTDQKKAEKRGEFFAFSRRAYGIVKTRTDGTRLLVYTDSGKTNMKEAYCYSLDQNGLPVPAPLVRA
ncbi:competence protein [Leptolyngbya sp. 'hensonii']|uniref:ComEC/Rec2 family competence protein n=1 Tax=Leptolyngbya sp. 'hensonii' TaxID=1922337 RepID=UPI00094F8167|nr:MBL fold metallo-hydrolase [Leptolyngbya sp. 'hensonii']OLP16561.1 competence protein [Leptolyngbya sp. 'hensonii']